MDNLNLLSRPNSNPVLGLTSNIPGPITSLHLLATPISAAIESELHISNFASDTDPLFRIICILRRVSLRKLYSFSGWQTSASETEESEKSIEIWMQGNEHSARECLWHAAVVFSALRNQSCLPGHAPLCMLVAAIYIWAYDKLSHHNLAKKDDGTPVTTIRLDSILDLTRVEKWIKGGPGISRVHIKQVGLLNGSDSILRLLSELERALLVHTAWSGLCGGLAFAVRTVIEGGRPSLQPE